jgi:hypothetical protein
MTHRSFWVFRALGSTLRMKAEVDQQQRAEDFICRQEKGCMDLETVGPMGQVENWVFIDYLNCPRAEKSLRCKQRFPGKKKCLLGKLSPFGTSCSPSFKSPPLNDCPD